jgi:hypothetical protein
MGFFAKIKKIIINGHYLTYIKTYRANGKAFTLRFTYLSAKSTIQKLINVGEGGG